MHSPEQRGAFWFSCAGHVLDYPRDKAWWTTAGDGDMNWHVGDQKFVRIEGLPADEYQPTTELLDHEIDRGEYSDGDLDDLRAAAMIRWSPSTSALRSERTAATM